MLGHSVEADLRDIQSRAEDSSVHRLEFVRRTNRQVLLSIGNGDRQHLIGIRESQVSFIQWLGENLRTDLSDAPILLVGEPHAGQWECGIISAVVLALCRGQRARIYSAWPLGLAARIVRSLLPDECRDYGGDALGRWRFDSSGEVEIVSIKELAAWSGCDIAVIDDCASSAQERIDLALSSAPTGILCGDTPGSVRQQWLLAYGDAARNKQRLFRFKWADHESCEKRQAAQ